MFERLIDEIWHAGRVQTIDELYDPDYVGHDPTRPVPAFDRAVLHRRVAVARAAFSGLRIEIHDVVCAGDRLAFRFVARARHTGALGRIAPTGRRVTITGAEILRTGPAGKVLESWTYADALGLLRQLAAARPDDGGRGSSGWVPDATVRVPLA
jgi:hypothetical protein